MWSLCIIFILESRRRRCRCLGCSWVMMLENISFMQILPQERAWPRLEKKNGHREAITSFETNLKSVAFLCIRFCLGHWWQPAKTTPNGDGQNFLGKNKASTTTILRCRWSLAKLTRNKQERCNEFLYSFWNGKFNFPPNDWVRSCCNFLAVRVRGEEHSRAVSFNISIILTNKVKWKWVSLHQRVCILAGWFQFWKKLLLAVNGGYCLNNSVKLLCCKVIAALNLNILCFNVYI